MSVDLLSRDHGYASERRSAEARFALSLRNARIAAKIGKTIEIAGDEDRLESRTKRIWEYEIFRRDIAWIGEETGKKMISM